MTTAGTRRSAPLSSKTGVSPAIAELDAFVAGAGAGAPTPEHQV